MDGAHTHGRGPTSLSELMAVGAGIALAAMVLARALTFLLIGLAVAGGLLVIGFIGYVVVACRRYKQEDTRLNAGFRSWPIAPDDPPRGANADPVTLRQAITELQVQLLAARADLPMTDGSWHQHLHLHGLTPEQAAVILSGLRDRQDPGSWQDGGSQ